MLRQFQTCLVLCACVSFTWRVCATWMPLHDSAVSSWQSQASTTPAPSDADAAKKPKKVWTNEDLGVASSTVAQPGDEKNSSRTKPAALKSTNPYVISLRQQLQKLQAQLADIDKQIGDLDSFRKGDTYGNGALQLHKRYNAEPIDAQIAKLQDKKKQLEAKQGALLDDARKKGVDPGQLR
jgi:hypothetical protein